ncbi:glycosyltransferase [Aeromonas veronii]|uniref:glycosyltransferase n=1 Tax=Aeromonas veronii TaxID=654 RepID=UPI002416AD2B|nr:glycosyltransferase [Aeromonas veronii]WFO49857.1 glycosyltransferase [Aeromonas veronii]
MNSPIISVVIPTYNRSKLLGYTLDSLVKQTLSKAYYEVIVVDDGGVDCSKDTVLEYESKINIQYIWQKDKGFRAGKARNVGTMMADGKYIMYLDSGVLLSSDVLQAHYDIHLSSIHPTVIVGYVLGFDADIDNQKLILERLDPYDVDSSILKLKETGVHDIRQIQYDELGFNIHCWPAPFDIFWTCHVSAERDELIKAGLFDETFNTWGGEDVDLGVRLHRNNNLFILQRNAVSIHWPHSKRVENYSSKAEMAAKKIHMKYSYWTTSFYGVDIGGQKYPLNKTIHLINSELTKVV